MATSDPIEEWRRLTDRYYNASDGELEELAAHAYELTDDARNVLRSEISRRRLDVQLVLDSPEFAPDQGPIGDYDASELELVSAATAWDRAEAERLVGYLKAAGIATFIGDENIQELEDFQGSFENGVDIKVRQVDRDWASRALYNMPDPPDSARDPGAEKLREEEEDERLARCPKCQQPDIVFVGFDPPIPRSSRQRDSKYMWRCDNCGHQWKDDGVELLA